MNKVFSEIYNLVWKEVFPMQSAMEMEKFVSILAPDLVLPEKYDCAITGLPTYGTRDYGYKRYITEEERIRRAQNNNMLQDKVEIGSLADTLEQTKKVAYFRGSKALNSDVVEESDNIFSSSYVFRSSTISGSHRMMFCYNMGPSEYMLASKNSKAGSFGIRIFDSDSVANSFDVSFSLKCSGCYFCHDCFGLRDCMFCFDVASKQFCIGNMQFTESEYQERKEKILKDYFEQLERPGAFRFLADL